MLAKTPKTASIEKTIAAIQSAFAQNPDPGFPHAERQARQDAADAVAASREALRRLNPHRPGSNADPAVERAEAALSRAEQELQAAITRFAAAKDARSEAFVVGVRNHFDEAAPRLSEIVSILDDALRPLVEIHEYARRQGLPVPRALESVATVQAGVSALRSIVNSSATV